MIITAILSVLIIWCLFYGLIPIYYLIPLCVGLGVGIAILSRHKHTQFLTIDVLAQKSLLNKINPTFKFFTVIILMMLCISSQSPIVGIFLALMMLILIVFVGGLHLHDYVYALAIPVSFLIIGGLVLLFEVTSKQISSGLSINVFGFWLSVTETTRANTALVLSRAFGAVSCLYLLSLTTPMSELIGVLRRLHCPDILIELMYLIYRYIFLLLSMHHSMRDAAKSRLGLVDYRTSVKTTGNLYANLLSRSYRLASQNFDAMESRCYDKGINFLEKRERIKATHVVIAGIIVMATLALLIVFY